HTVLAAILRDYRPINPDRDERFERGDELLFLTAREGEESLSEIPELFTSGGIPGPELTPGSDPAPMLG
ncbi:MAG: potassium transporter TrkA, partial [Actinomyces sp.]